MKQSSYVLGRKPALRLFNETGEVTVSVVPCNGDQWRACIEAPTRKPPFGRVLYRIRARRKGEAA